MVKIRPYQERDFDNLARLSTSNRNYVANIDRWQYIKPATDKYGQMAVEKYLKDAEKNQGLILIAKDGTKAIGCGIATVISPDEFMKLRHRSNYQTYGYIKNVFVEESYRDQGIGSEIMSNLEEYLAEEGCKMVWLEVFKPNKNAKTLYKNVGYEELSEIMIKKI